MQCLDETSADASAIRILLVDDDPIQRDVLSLLLGQYDYIVDTAGDGFDAVRMARDNPYDLLLVDYHMREMDGLAVARLIRDLGSAGEPALIALTGAPLEIMRSASEAAYPFDDILAKPSPMVNLVFSIESGIRLARNRVAARICAVSTRSPCGDADLEAARHAAAPRILVVEDDAMQQMALRQILECRGYDVQTAANGMEAVRLTSTGAFDLVLLDYRLPHMDGLTTARMILDSSSATRPRMIGLTADTENLVRQQARVGDIFDEVVPKPQDVASLLATVTRHLATEKAPPAR